MSVPSQDEEPLCRCRALYLGTSVFNTKTKKFSESNLNLSILQDSISERYPVDGSNYAKGIETWLSIFPSGIQMEHSSSKDITSISALFHYPIKSLVYCGALRFIFLPTDNQSDNESNVNARSWRFVPVDTDLAQTNENIKNPPLFVVFVKGIDPTTKKQIIECHVFVVGMKKTAMKLIESCQKAFSSSKTSVTEFFKKYGNVPVVYCMKNELGDKTDKRVVVKSFDSNGYFYATESTPIDCWQLFEANNSPPPTRAIYEAYTPINPHYEECVPSRKKIIAADAVCETVHSDIVKNDYLSNQMSSTYLDPYEPSENLIKVEKRFDPITGQNIYVRYLADSNICETKTYDIPTLLYNDEKVDETELSMCEQPKVIVRREEEPSPIIFEKYIKKRAPQVIIKEIHVHEPAPPPIKVVQKINGCAMQRPCLPVPRQPMIAPATPLPIQPRHQLRIPMKAPVMRQTPVPAKPIRRMICQPSYGCIPTNTPPHGDFYSSMPVYSTYNIPPEILAQQVCTSRIAPSHPPIHTASPIIHHSLPNYYGNNFYSKNENLINNYDRDFYNPSSRFQIENLPRTNNTNNVIRYRNLSKDPTRRTGASNLRTNQQDIISYKTYDNGIDRKPNRKIILNDQRTSRNPHEMVTNRTDTKQRMRRDNSVGAGPRLFVKDRLSHRPSTATYDIYNRF